MNRLASAALVFLPTPAFAGFVVPRGATDVVRAPGFVRYELKGVDHIRYASYNTLLSQVRAATKYSKANGGNLPDSAFWFHSADVYDDNVARFAREHQCAPLLKLLKRDDEHDNRVPPPVMPVPPPTITEPPPVMPVPPVGPITPPQPPPVVNPPAVTPEVPTGPGNPPVVVPPTNPDMPPAAAVPEPASALLWGFAVVGALVARFIRKGVGSWA